MEEIVKNLDVLKPGLGELGGISDLAASGLPSPRGLRSGCPFRGTKMQYLP